MSMSEDVFFNPGNSIASDYDYSKAYIAAQIYHQRVEKPVLLVKGENSNDPYIVFDEEAAVEEEKQEEQNAKSYKVVKRLDD